MSKNFDDLLTKLKVAKTKKLAVAVAQDEPVLEAVKAAKDRGIADAILVGDREKIEAVAMGILTMGLSGELADKNDIAIGSFREELMNNVYKMNSKKLKEYGRCE